MGGHSPQKIVAYIKYIISKDYRVKDNVKPSGKRGYIDEENFLTEWYEMDRWSNDAVMWFINKAQVRNLKDEQGTE